MRSQTWSLTIQVDEKGVYAYAIVHSTYTKTGRQLPNMLAQGEACFEDIRYMADEMADYAIQSLTRESHGQIPLDRLEG